MTPSRPYLAASRWPLLGFAALILALLAIYGRDVGHGFVKDDVVWVGESRVASAADLPALAVRSNGFYRPVVALTFAADRALYDLRPLGYGVTNLLLLIAASGALVWLGRGLGVGAGVAVLAAAIWALNFHGINMAVLWLSGRTALLVSLFALIAAGTQVRGWRAVAAVAALLAMLSKEEAVLLPLILSSWVWLRPGTSGNSRARVARETWMAWLALAVYLVLRSQTGAYTPASSPWFYRFTFASTHVIANAAQYLDRACTFATLAVIVASLVAWHRPRLTERVRQTIPLALVWIAGSYALTLFLPVRSSLYACLPSIGAALLAAVAIETVWTAAGGFRREPRHDRRQRQNARVSNEPAAGTYLNARGRLVAAAIALPVLLLPVYWSRNVRWVEIADLSAVTFAVVRDTVGAGTSRTGDASPSRSAAAPPDSNVSHLVFEDDRSTRVSLVNTFGTLLPEAVALAAGRRLPVWLDPPPDDWQGSGLTPPPAAIAGTTAHVVRFRVEGNTLLVPAP